MIFVEPSSLSSRKLLCGSVALLALVLTSCTSTGDGMTPMQMSASADGSVVADALQSAADETAAAEASTKAEAEASAKAEADATKKADNQPEPPTGQAAVTSATAQSDNPAIEDAGTGKALEPEEPVQVAALASETKPSGLFSIFGKKSDNSPSEAAPPEAPAATTDEKPATAKTEPAQEAPQAPQVEASQPPAPEKPAEVTSLFGSAKNANAFAAPQKPASSQSQSQGSIARLFSDDAASGSSKAENKKLAVVKPVSSPTRNYNYSLPGVRANGGIEIKHRQSLYDDSDIDANEYDDYSSIQLASAPGLARLAPNGLKVQRQTVDVACLKPQLVSMLKTMERHFRRPVMVTSGYRSPSYNRKVNGARKSLHMICAAADIQIDGVSKHEIARFARSMPNRGGVGTYCHTKSVHVDIGPERDWNWRCRK